MAIQINWHPSLPSTIYYEFSEIWSWQEYGDAFKEEIRLASLLEGGSYHVIANLLGTSLIPRGSAFSYVYDTVKSSPDNMGQVVIITSNSFFMTMFTTLLTIHPSIRETLYITNTLEDAKNYISNLS